MQRLGFVGGAFFPEVAGHALDVYGGAWFVVPGICVYVAWLGGGAIIPGSDTHTPSTGEGKRRAGAPSLALEGLCNWFSGF